METPRNAAGNPVEPITGIELDLSTPLMDPKVPHYGKNADVVSFRAPSELNREIDILVHEDTGLPFKTRTDFYRAAGHFFLIWLTEAAKVGNPGLRRRMVEHRLATDAADKSAWLTRRQQTYADMHTYLVALLDELAFDEIYRTLNDYFREINQITVSHWRRQYISGMLALQAVQVAVVLLTQSGRGAPPEYVEALTYAASHSTGGPGSSTGDGSDGGVPPDPEIRGDDSLHEQPSRVESPGQEAPRLAPISVGPRWAAAVAAP